MRASSTIRFHLSFFLSILILLTHGVSMFPVAQASDQQVVAHEPQSDDFVQLDAVANEELKARRTPGATIALVSQGRVIYAKGYGVASVETNVPVTPEVLFRLGSTTKMLTAAALVTLAAEGKLSLDDPIGKYIKGLNPRMAQVTAHQLLSQSAGLRDFGPSVISNDEIALSNQVRTWKEDVFFTDPGKVYSYSSPGYWLSGALIEGVSGKLYADALDDLIFKPVGMNRTTLRPQVAMTYPLTVGHKVEGQGAPVVIRPAFNNAAMWPGGSVYSNVGDLSRFVIALMNSGQLEGKPVLAPLVVSKLPTPHVELPGGEGVHYGYGLMSYEHRGVHVVTHGGASTGYGSSILMVPAHKVAVIVLTNKSGETLGRTREKALELMLALKPRVREERKLLGALTEAEMSKYVGSYSHAPLTWEVFVREGKLFLKSDGPESELKPAGGHTFVYGPSNSAEVVFVPGADGRAEHLFTGLYSARRNPS